MPELQLQAGETKTVQDIVRFAANMATDLSPEARKALLISLVREFRQEVQAVMGDKHGN